MVDRIARCRFARLLPPDGDAHTSLTCRRRSTSVFEVDDVEARPRFAAGNDARRAGTIAENNAGRAILVVDDARHHVGADHERVIVARRWRQAGWPPSSAYVNARTGRAQVEAPGAMRADLVLQ